MILLEANKGLLLLSWKKGGASMANNAVLSTLHNQYLSTYQPLKGNSRYDTHKRSELRNIYNSMISVNKDAPLYKFDTSIESKNYIVGLKEASRALHNTFVAVAGRC